MMRYWHRRLFGLGTQRGVTLVELVSATAVVLVLASITLPVANTMVKRQKELELRRALRQAGFLTRDAREVERKKVGLHKARKRPQYSKR